MENMKLSGKDRKPLEFGESMKKETIKEYLKAGYTGEGRQQDIEVSGTVYKALKREDGETTTFYDGSGNTLFSMGNAELAAEYKKENAEEGKGQDEKQPESEKELPAETGKEDGAAKLAAREKLEKELEGAKDKNFAKPIINYLMERCGEDEGMAEDVAQDHKTFQKCSDYIYGQAKKLAVGNCAAVKDDVVYEWAEDYYRRDDKTEEEKKAKQAAEARSKKASGKKQKVLQKSSANADKGKTENRAVSVKEEKSKGQPKPKKSRDMEGQLDIFSIMGMGGAADE